MRLMEAESKVGVEAPRKSGDKEQKDVCDTPSESQVSSEMTTMSRLSPASCENIYGLDLDAVHSAAQLTSGSTVECLHDATNNKLEDLERQYLGR